MKQLCAIFEDWFLGDGIYPAFRKGQQQQLSFTLKLQEKRQAASPAFFFNQVQHAEYHFCGSIVQNYKIRHQQQVVVIDTGDYIFYFEEPESAFVFNAGRFIEGKAQLYVDYNLYFESLDHSFSPFTGFPHKNNRQLLLDYCMRDRHAIPDISVAGDMLYQFFITEIIKVRIPARFLQKKGAVLTYPSSLAATAYSWQDMCIITDMANDTAGPSFYLLQLEEQCLQ